LGELPEVTDESLSPLSGGGLGNAVLGGLSPVTLWSGVVKTVSAALCWLLSILPNDETLRGDQFSDAWAMAWRMLFSVTGGESFSRKLSGSGFGVSLGPAMAERSESRIANGIDSSSLPSAHADVPVLEVGEKRKLFGRFDLGLARRGRGECAGDPKADDWDATS
jgi:hypothetical protein